MKDWSSYTKVVRLKIHLVKSRGHKCEKCQQETWQGEPIPLEIEHTNGDRTDNSIENLKLLCCNCHALTPTWRGRSLRGIKRVERENCLSCDLPLHHAGKFCNAKCSNKYYDITKVGSKTKINWPIIDDLQQMVNKNGFTATGRILGVSSSSVRQRLKR